MPRNNNENVATFRESKMASIRSNATCNCANMQFVHMRTYLESVIIDSILFFSISFVKARSTHAAQLCSPTSRLFLNEILFL